MRGSALAIRIAIATVILAALIFGTYEVLESPGNQLSEKRSFAVQATSAWSR